VTLGCDSLTQPNVKDFRMETSAVLLEGAKQLSIQSVGLKEPTDGDVVVQVSHSGISTGTENLLWSGTMPPFPGMGYPLVPGYEAVGEVIHAEKGAALSPGDYVFVPGSNGFKAGMEVRVPDLIIGHGVLGRMLARLTLAAGGEPPTVWEIDEARRDGAVGYEVVHPDTDSRNNYRAIFDASGRSDLLDQWIQRGQKGAEIVLAGFYSERINFAFPPAFMKEIKIRIAAEWSQSDLIAVRALVESGALSLGGLITHRSSAEEADLAYRTAFETADCIKMMLDWSDIK
jgi:3-hydroxyethyl bacteriochlorophyllide a dehydrogenase